MKLFQMLMVSIIPCHGMSDLEKSKKVRNEQFGLEALIITIIWSLSVSIKATNSFNRITSRQNLKE